MTIGGMGRRWEYCRAGCQAKIAYTHKQSAMNMAALETVKYGSELYVYTCGDHYHITSWFKLGAHNYILGPHNYDN